MAVSKIRRKITIMGLETSVNKTLDGSTANSLGIRWSSASLLLRCLDFSLCQVEDCPTYCSPRAADETWLGDTQFRNIKKTVFPFWSKDQGMLSVTELSYSFTSDLLFKKTRLRCEHWCQCHLRLQGRNWTWSSCLGTSSVLLSPKSAVCCRSAFEWTTGVILLSQRLWDCLVLYLNYSISFNLEPVFLLPCTL